MYIFSCRAPKKTAVAALHARIFVLLCFGKTPKKSLYFGSELPKRTLPGHVKWNVMLAITGSFVKMISKNVAPTTYLDGIAKESMPIKHILAVAIMYARKMGSCRDETRILITH